MPRNLSVGVRDLEFEGVVIGRWAALATALDLEVFDAAWFKVR